MSNLFNTPAARAKISSLLNIKNYHGEKYTNRGKQVPDAIITNPRKMVEFLKERKRNVLHKKGIPKNEETPMELVLPDYYETLFGRDEVMLPDGDEEYIPRYYPTFTSSKADAPLMNQLLYLYIERENDDATTPTGKFILDINEAIENVTFCNGTYEGMLERYTKMWDIRYGLNGKHKPKTPEELGYTLEDIATLLEVTMPITPPKEPESGETLPLTLPMSKYLTVTSVDDEGEITGVDDQLPSLNMNSIAGIPYLQRRKKEVVPESIVICDTALRGVTEVLKNTKTAEEFMRENWWMGAGLYFPKHERYDNDKILNKTRLIWSAPTATNMLGQKILQCLDVKINCLNYETPSLRGFSPFHGGMNKFINDFIYADKTSVRIYADNIYILYKNKDGTSTYYSIDLEKGEANATPYTGQALGYYLLTRGWVDDEGSPAFNATWAAIATRFIPAWSIDSYAVLMNQMLKVPGLGSGAPITFVINHATSTIWVAEWTKMGKPKPSDEVIRRVAERTGIDAKIELVSEDIQEKLNLLIENTPREGYLQETKTSEPPEQKLPTVEMDLLGFDAAYSHMFKSYIPILNYERLVRSAAWPKVDTEDKAQQQAYFVVEKEALRLVGGWSIGILDTACKNMASSSRKNLLDKGYDLKTFAVNWMERTDLFGQVESESMPEIDLSVPLTHEAIEKLHKPQEFQQISKEDMPKRSYKPEEHKGTQSAIQWALQDKAPSWSKAKQLLTTTAKKQLRDVLQQRDEILKQTQEELERLWKEEIDWDDRQVKVGSFDQETGELSTRDKNTLVKGMKEIEQINNTLQNEAPPKAQKTEWEKDTETAANPNVAFKLKSGSVLAGKYEGRGKIKLTKTQKRNRNRRK